LKRVNPAATLPRNVTASPASPPSSAAGWLDRIFLAVALTLPLLWMPTYERISGGHGLCDEPGHMEVIHSIAGRRPLPPELTMVPGYHFVVNALARHQPTMTLARQVSMVMAVIGTAVFALAWHRLHRQPAGAATLLFALLPILQPFSGMAYTEAMAVALLLAVWWAHDAGQRTLAGLLFVTACCVRQTNAVWGGFIILLEAWNAWRPADGSRPPLPQAAIRTLQRTWGFLAVILAGLGVALWHGRMTVGTQHGNQLQPNIATLHFAGMLALLLGLPAWLAMLTRAPGRLREWSQTRPAQLAAGLAAGSAAAAILAWSFANPHIWNRELFWPDTSFTLIRNWPLVWTDRHGALQIASGMLLVLLAVATWRGFQAQSRRRELWLVLFCGAILLATNRLVDPRYYITPAVMLLLFLDLDTRLTRWLAAWFALICAVHAPFIARGLSLW
jgi:hypothetical protein